MIFFSPLSNYTVDTKATISSTINNIFSNTQQLQQQQQLQHHGLLWTVLRPHQRPHPQAPQQGASGGTQEVQLRRGWLAVGRGGPGGQGEKAFEPSQE
jgi:hypothetical protein